MIVREPDRGVGSESQDVLGVAGEAVDQLRGLRRRMAGQVARRQGIRPQSRALPSLRRPWLRPHLLPPTDQGHHLRHRLRTGFPAPAGSPSTPARRTEPVPPDDTDIGHPAVPAISRTHDRCRMVAEPDRVPARTRRTGVIAARGSDDCYGVHHEPVSMTRRIPAWCVITLLLPAAASCGPAKDEGDRQAVRSATAPGGGQATPTGSADALAAGACPLTVDEVASALGVTLPPDNAPVTSLNTCSFGTKAPMYTVPMIGVQPFPLSSNPEDPQTLTALRSKLDSLTAGLTQEQRASQIGELIDQPGWGTGAMHTPSARPSARTR